MGDYDHFRERTARELGLAGNHYAAIPKHLDAYEHALAVKLADQIQEAFYKDPDNFGVGAADALVRSWKAPE